MADVRLRALDGADEVPLTRIAGLRVVDGTLVADVPGRDAVVLAAGTEPQLRDAAMALLPELEKLGEGSFLVEAQEHGGTIGWLATADDGSGGAGWGAASTPAHGKTSGHHGTKG